MTPQEKAKDLFDKIYKLDNRAWYDVAKQCALIAVDEIINSVVIMDLTVAENQFNYWEQVKHEIELL